MIVKPINRMKISSQIFIELQNFLSKANLKPGDRLPSERELAQSLQVSRNSLREAFRVLEILGLIDIIPGSGTYIRRENDNTILPLAMALSIEQNSVVELMEVRLILECSVANLAAKRRDEQDLYQIKNVLEEMKTLPHDLQEWVRADIRFHYSIAAAAKNSLLLRLYRTIADSLAETIHIAAKNRFKTDQEILTTIEEHVLIYEQIKNQNGTEAYEKMSQHLRGVYEDIKESC